MEENESVEKKKIDMSVEIWKDIKGYEGIYQVSNYGRVRSLDGFDSAGRKRRGRMLTQKNVGSNVIYKAINLSTKGTSKQTVLQKIVYETFFHSSEGLRIKHLDGDVFNNRCDNLITINNSENILLRTKNNKNGKSKYRGVSFRKGDKKNHTKNAWTARACVNYVRIHIGHYKTEIEAAKAYDKWMYENCKGLFETNESLGLL